MKSMNLPKEECLFCKIANKIVPAEVIFENDSIISFLDIDPINEGHILIIPKKHFLDLENIDNETLFEILVLSKKMIKILKIEFSPDGYTIMQNGGCFNDIGHFHLHIFPRYKHDGFSWICNDSDKEPLIKIREKFSKWF